MQEKPDHDNKKKLPSILRTIVEVGFIVFLFYSNLLMGEFTRSRLGHVNGLWWAIEDIFTITNFIIAVVLSLTGYLVFEFFRKRL